jgi:hypothetical protein
MHKCFKKKLSYLHNPLDLSRNSYKSWKLKSCTIIFHFKIPTATSNQQQIDSRQTPPLTLVFEQTISFAYTRDHIYLTTNHRLARLGKLVLQFVIPVAVSAVWLPNFRFTVDGWFYLSNLSCSFLLVIYENSFHRSPTLQVLVRPSPFNPCWFASSFSRHILKQRSKRIA